MKVLFVSSFYYPHAIGGAETTVKLLAEGVVRSGDDRSWGIHCRGRSDHCRAGSWRRPAAPTWLRTRPGWSAPGPASGPASCRE